MNVFYPMRRCSLFRSIQSCFFTTYLELNLLIPSQGLFFFSSQQKRVREGILAAVVLGFMDVVLLSLPLQIEEYAALPRGAVIQAVKSLRSHEDLYLLKLVNDDKVLRQQTPVAVERGTINKWEKTTARERSCRWESESELQYPCTPFLSNAERIPLRFLLAHLSIGSSSSFLRGRER